MSVSRAQYITHSGLSKGRVSQLVKSGMPLDSLEAADAWRDDNVGNGLEALRRRRRWLLDEIEVLGRLKAQAEEAYFRSRVAFDPNFIRNREPK